MSVLLPLPHNLPVELREYPQWVLWWLEQRHQRATKVPYQPSGRRASVSDPATWISFEDACDVYGSDKQWDGIGFVFTEHDPFTGIDFDHCVGQDDTIAPQVLAHVQRLNIYVEYSPSRTGLHAIVCAHLTRGKRTKQVEIYPAGRFFTMTGHVLSSFNRRIAAHQSLNFLFDVTGLPTNSPLTNWDNSLLRRIRASKNGNIFEQLWRGQWQGYASQSEADLALCAHLSFWTRGDAQTIDRLFRQSGLMRPKWDESHFRSGMTYGQATVQKAVSNDVGVAHVHGDESPRTYDTPRQEIPELQPFWHVANGKCAI